jgi:outer membrane immunogenic protein
MPVKAEPVAPPMTWTGCYVGAGGGYGMWNQDHSLVSLAGVLESPRSTIGGRGWFGTAQVGCDYQFDQNWVIGAFVDGNWGSLRGDYSEPFVAGAVGREKEKWSYAGGGRLGYVIYPQLLGFVSAGYTDARFSAFSTFVGAALANTYASHSYGGYFIGTGYEYRLAWLPGFTWKTEVRASDYGRGNVGVFTPAGVLASTMQSHKYEQTVRSELVWRFNSWR